MLVKLICPDCRAEIARSNSEWRCPKCGRRFPLVHGILSFLTDAEKFNEGEFEEKQKHAWSDSAQLRQKISQSSWLSLLNTVRIKFSFSGRRDRIFYNEMAHGGKSRLILDLGCGGGRHYFCDYGTVIGVDPVLELLPLAQKLYAEVYHAGGYQLPFADNSFDYVVSSDVLGHIPFDKKDALFAEMHRVLKPGGRAVHVIETDGTNVWFREAKKIPGYFQKYFIDVPGHVGMELPTALQERFLRHGFKTVRFQKLYGFFQPLGVVAAFFDPALDRFPRRIRLAAHLDRLLSRFFPVREGLHFVIEPLAFVTDRLTPLDHGSGMLVVFEK